jgi:hypothetical protein
MRLGLRISRDIFDREEKRRAGLLAQEAESHSGTRCNTKHAQESTNTEGA